MKAVAPSLNLSSLRETGWVAVLSELFKARLTFLVLLTTLTGFYLGERGDIGNWRLISVLTGTALLASAAAALNQWMERGPDARMERTQKRPLPNGDISPSLVLALGLGCSMLGLAVLYYGTPWLTFALGLATLLTYLLIYTPLKRVSPWNTAVGAIPGALPPLIGWTAARGELSLEGLSLFGILAFWQIPHFMAIAWLYREDYLRGGFAMLPKFDPAGQRTATQALAYASGLLLMGLVPYWVGLTGAIYAAGALALGGLFVACAIAFLLKRNDQRARYLFYASILYLPMMLGLMAIDKVT